METRATAVTTYVTTYVTTPGGALPGYPRLHYKLAAAVLLIYFLLEWYISLCDETGSAGSV